MSSREGADFPIAAGILFGLGLGGFFDGIVLHQMLQWHHMLTDAGYPATSVENLKSTPSGMACSTRPRTSSSRRG